MSLPIFIPAIVGTDLRRIGLNLKNSYKASSNTYVPRLQTGRDRSDYTHKHFSEAPDDPVCWSQSMK